MDQKLYDLIDASRDEYVAMLKRWVEVPSVKAASENGAPFGSSVNNMLELAMNDARAMGFAVRGFDGYACDVTLSSEEKEKLAVLGHLDVVPAGDGWKTDPFTAVQQGDKLYGRGTIDDKGPALAALFAMKAIKDAGIPLKKSIRLILGCDEESGWEDMDYYCKHAEMPESGFSPDASFPIINTEKAMLRFIIKAPVASDGLKIRQLWIGERVNVIPGEAKVLVEGSNDTVAAVRAYAAKTGLEYRAEKTADGVLLTATGIPGHAAYPEGCRNAIGMMLLLLKELGATGSIATLANAIGMESDGRSLGAACSDGISGALTNNIGILHLENGTLTATLDYRCPVTADLDALIETTKAHLPGFTFDVKKTAPHHVSADSELVKELLAAYHEETGLPAVPQSTGGGTYAKVLKQGVAFGAAFPDEPDLCHQPDECVSISNMMASIRVYANALMRLCAE